MPTESDGRGLHRARGRLRAMAAAALGAAALGACSTAPDPCPGKVGVHPVAITVHRFSDGERGTARGFGIMASPGVLWTAAHVLPTGERAGPLVVDGMGSSFVQTERQILMNPERRRLVGDWSEATLGWLPDPAYGLDGALAEVAAGASAGDHVLMRTIHGDFPGVVVEVLDVIDRFSRRRYPGRSVVVRFSDAQAHAAGHSGSPVLLIDGGTPRLLGLFSGVIDWPDIPGEQLAAVTRPPCQPCESPAAGSGEATAR